MKNAAAGVIYAIAVLLFTTALGLSVIHLTGFPYSLDVDYLKIPEMAGIPRDEVLQNYDAIMDYLSPFSDSDFSLPTLSYTKQASGHFADCKFLFNVLYILGGLSAFILILISGTRMISKGSLKISGALTMAIPAFIGAALAIDFDRAFDLFHKIFFEGASWIFNPATDGFIRIMPSTFFMHCAVFIALFWLSGAIVQLVAGYSNNRSRRF
ncbi:MAG: TIGR01906 family membrane protein [Oscillospiraceae bacterium]